MFIPVLLSLTVHEWAHAWTALKLGDDTAKLLGRVSLNPVDHIDPVGTLLPLLGVPFGWAKPVPINPLRFRTNMATGVLLTAAAGPISNLILAIAGVALFAAAPVLGLQSGLLASIKEFLQDFILINLLLACFNLIPIPPLDGSRIVDALLPASMRAGWNRFCSLGPLLLVAVILLPGLLGFSLLAWPMHWVRELLQAVSGW